MVLSNCLDVATPVKKLIVVYVILGNCLISSCIDEPQSGQLVSADENCILIQPLQSSDVQAYTDVSSIMTSSTSCGFLEKYMMKPPEQIL